MKSKTGYRIWQFFQSLKQPLGDDDWKVVESILSPAELALFRDLPTQDQNHSIRVLEGIQALGEDAPDLLKAALLHDLGKLKYPLSRWERVVAVLITGLFPNKVKYWGEGEPVGLKRPLVVIRKHPDWGADLAEKAGSDPRTVWLIRHHEDGKPEETPVDLTKLLDILQIVDNQN
jgi:hypothetical protein